MSSHPKSVAKWKAFLEGFELIARHRSGRHNIDMALWHVLAANVNELGAFPRNGSQRYNFHKGFRQYDVTGCGHQDMTIWYLIHESLELMPAMEKFSKKSTPGPKPLREKI